MVSPRLRLASLLGLALALPVCRGSVHGVGLSASAAGSGGMGGHGSSSGGAAGASGAGGHYWTIEPRPAALSVIGCAFVEGQPAFVRAVLTATSSCERVGPAAASITPPGSIAVTGFVWVEHGVVCEQVEDAEARDVLLHGLTHGTWAVVDTTGPSKATLVIGGPPPPSTCTNPGPAGAGCVADCDCLDGLPCLAEKSNAGCGGSCRQTCNQDLDCQGGQFCTKDSPFASNVCGSLVADACAGPADCPPGTSCAMPGMGQAAYCDWQPILSAATRHACADEAECAPPLHCVQGDNGKRVCQLPCFTSEMRCPSAHLCVPTTSYLGSNARWVCEWNGG